MGPSSHPPSKKTLAILLSCLVVAAAVAVRTAEFARKSGLPWYGFADSWISFAVITCVVAIAVWVGAELGLRWGGSFWCLLLAVALGSISAAAVNSTLGALCGLVVGMLRVPWPQLPAFPRMRKSVLAINQLIGHVFLPWATSFLAGKLCGFALQGPYTAAILGGSIGLLQVALVERMWRRSRASVDTPVPVKTRSWRLATWLLLASCCVPIGGISCVTGRWFGLLSRVVALRETGTEVYWDIHCQGLWERLWAKPIALAIRFDSPNHRDLAILQSFRTSSVEVWFSGPSLGDATVVELPDVSRYDSLTIARARITGDVIPPQLRMASATEITICSTPLTGPGLQSIGRESVKRGSLKWLRLDNTRVSPASWIELLEENPRPSLRSLRVSEPQLGVAEVSRLSRLPIRSLGLHCRHQTGHSDWTEFSSSAQLLEFNISVRELNPGDVEALIGMSRKGVRVSFELMTATLTEADVMALSALARETDFIAIEVTDATTASMLSGIPIDEVRIGQWLEGDDAAQLLGLGSASRLVVQSVFHSPEAETVLRTLAATGRPVWRQRSRLEDEPYQEVLAVWD